ncbi:dCTP deaminase domain-containing protein [Hymenobacter sp. B81]|uniref:dCTP deaminase domain-containing protein n=1 Tax=Hymenobacter sp. B81 TaxID=3344878 RepID=UPI0037DCEB7D
MSFLNNQRLLEVLGSNERIIPFDQSRIESGAYELSMGNEYFTTNTATATKKTLEPDEQFVIEPGQFALLITKEIIKIPANNLGFISIKASIKFKGLINVSGFHVDPGFHGRLKFSVYNAGSRAITISEGQKMFPLWLSEFSNTLEGDELYDGKYQNQRSISSEDVSKIEGNVVSPAVLNKTMTGLDTKFNTLDRDFKNLDTLAKTIGGIGITLLVLIIGKYVFADPNRALEKDVETRQHQVEKKFTHQDSILNAQGAVLVKLDSTLKRLQATQPQRKNPVTR